MTDAKSRPHILCLGIPTRDMLFRIGALPARGHKLPADHFDQFSGGNATNAAVAIARLGGKVRLAGPIGDNPADTQFILDLLTQEGVETEHLVRVAGAQTPMSSIWIDAGGERTLVIYRDPKLWSVTLPDNDTLLDGVDAVLTESRCSDFVAATCAEARRRDIAVVLDADRVMALDEPLLTISSHVIFSAEALTATAATGDLTGALKRIAELTTAFLAVTDGAEGTQWRDQTGQIRHTPAFPIQPVDTLGAGDVFHGAFALGISEGQDISSALRLGSAAAALKCTRFGSAYAAPQRAEVEALLAETAAT
ncbi:sugar kinase [Bradyrhizobium prioriisuperbiae]|uniref:sugar kinase n=1 Tax=Bradyrhizobium prioriisuperbiae TaxID=2854389 RepID=UPI0028EF5227|nr:sugar kinase [Bradyrhizobium prioritasuperba]